MIPFSRLPSGEHVLLLGRERFIPQWKGSCRWSGFEGSRKADETLVSTAVREFHEESLGVILSREDIVRIIRERLYWIRVVLRISNERKAERYHTTYLVHVPFDDRITDTFLSKRRSLEHLERLCRDFDRLAPTFSNIMEAEIGSVECTEEGVRLYRHSVNLLSECADAEPDDEDIVWSKREEGVDTISVPHAHPYATRIRAWNVAREELESNTYEFECICKHYGDVTGRLQKTHVLVEHLEKDQVRWWTESDLRIVLDQKGCMGDDCFRPYFLPVLQTVLHELARAPPTVPPQPQQEQAKNEDRDEQ